MTGTVKVKEDSSYIYKGATLKILGIYMVHREYEWESPFKPGSVEYKLCLKGTEWEARYQTAPYTIIHENHLEDIKVEGTLESEIWWNQLGRGGQNVVNTLFNKCGTKTTDEKYNSYLLQVTEK